MGGALSQRHFISMVIKVPLPQKKKKRRGSGPSPPSQLPVHRCASLFEFTSWMCEVEPVGGVINLLLSWLSAPTPQPFAL